MLLELSKPLRKYAALAVLTLTTGVLLLLIGRLLIGEIYRMEASEAIEKKSYGPAEESLLSALKVDGDNGTLLLNMGDFYLSISEQSSTPLDALNKSRQAYNKAIERNPYLAMAWYGLARNREKTQLISADQNTATPTGDSSSGSGSADLAWIEETDGYFQLAIALDANNAFLMLNYFSYLLRVKHYDKAESVYRRAYETAPDMITGYYLRLRSNNRAWGRIIEKVSWESINRNPQNARLYYALGRWYVAQGLYAHALAVYRKGLAASPMPFLEKQLRRVERLITTQNNRRRR
jgi:tetratricopeptide (TPR) repeat protein